MLKTDLAGHALYLELFREDAESTLQILFTTEMLNEHYVHVQPTMYHRVLTPTSPRATWRTKIFPGLSEVSPLTGTLVKRADKEFDETAVIRHSRIFNQIAAYGYKLSLKPIVVQVSVEDTEQLRAGRTPYKVLNRITKVRDQYSYPKLPSAK